MGRRPELAARNLRALGIRLEVRGKETQPSDWTTYEAALGALIAAGMSRRPTEEEHRAYAEAFCWFHRARGITARRGAR